MILNERLQHPHEYSGPGQLGRSQESVEVYDQVVTRFGDDLNSPYASRWPKHWSTKGLLLEQLHFGDDSALRELAAIAQKIKRCFARRAVHSSDDDQQ
ncbi:MAG: hypothetical protein LC749_20115 [Actinobacteria bacterium]|nr:hypothetical protein [Actinomycetota bacterium]